MKSILFKVNDKIKNELLLIRDREGLSTMTATLLFLVKYYFTHQKTSLSETVSLLDEALDKLDVDELPSLEDQLKDL